MAVGGAQTQAVPNHFKMYLKKKFFSDVLNS